MRLRESGRPPPHIAQIQENALPPEAGGCPTVLATSCAVEACGDIIPANEPQILSDDACVVSTSASSIIAPSWHVASVMEKARF